VILLACLLAACAPVALHVFEPFSYRSDLPRVSVYPSLAMIGTEIVLMARPIEEFEGEICLRVIDDDATAWHETCWEGGDSRRITFLPRRVGRHVAYLAYRDGDTWLTGPRDRATLCVLGEDADCP
jgi:hypothetical protein